MTSSIYMLSPNVGKTLIEKFIRGSVILGDNLADCSILLFHYLHLSEIIMPRKNQDRAFLHSPDKYCE
jgi:hypothetical protein